MRDRLVSRRRRDIRGCVGIDEWPAVTQNSLRLDGGLCIQRGLDAGVRIAHRDSGEPEPHAQDEAESGSSRSGSDDPRGRPSRRTGVPSIRHFGRPLPNAVHDYSATTASDVSFASSHTFQLVTDALSQFDVAFEYVL